MITVTEPNSQAEDYSSQTPIADNQLGKTTPIACNLTAIDDEVRPQHVDLALYLFGEGLLERQELPDGYAFRYAPDNYRAVADFIETERLCCPFFNFTLEVTPENGPIWLRITGRPGVKELLMSMLDDITKDHKDSENN